MDENIIGLLLAITSSVLIGASFVITKKGLVSTRNKRNAAGRPDVDNHTYLKNVIWWIGMATMVCGEIANFAAYSFAPAVLVTPLGALSVLIGAVLANFLLNEKLGKVGICGCALCLIGSVMIVLHAPADQAIESVDSIVTMVLQPAFIVYSAFVLIFSLVMIFKISPQFGKKNMLVYVSICSFVGSITVLSSKGFGIALKLTFQGNNQLAHPGTWIFAFCLIVCAIVQVNYFNRALGFFSTNLVTPIYYVFFTTATIAASAILFQGFHESSVVNVISLFCGFLTIFVGVFLLNTENPSKIAKVLQDEVVAIRECDLEKGSPTESATGHQPPESSSLDSLDRPMTSLSRNRDTEMHVNDLRPLSP